MLQMSFYELIVFITAIIKLYITISKASKRKKRKRHKRKNRP